MSCINSARRHEIYGDRTKDAIELAPAQIHLLPQQQQQQHLKLLVMGKEPSS